MVLSFARAVIYLFLPWMIWRILWRRLFKAVLDNVPGPEPESWLTGSLNQLRSPTAWGFHQTIADKYGGVIRVKGLLGRSNLYVFDPKALHHILVKDQYVYEETEAFVASNKMIFGQGIFTSLGEEHRRQRKMLNPVFSIAHMREMVPIFYEVAHKVHRAFLEKVKSGPQEVDVMGWMTRLALELIGQSGLGYTFDELTENSVPHPYGIASKQLIPVSGKSMILRLSILPYLTKIGTPRFRRFVVDLLPFSGIQRFKDILDVLHRTSVEILESKRQAIREGDKVMSAQIGRGKDIISILMKANMLASDDEKLSEDELLGQITSLTFAATDTTSGALSRTLHLLAQHPDVQEKLREEIRNARKNNDGQDIGYDELVSLPYLDAICRETLRLQVTARSVLSNYFGLSFPRGSSYPPVSTVLRAARQNIVLPLATPIKGIDGEDIREIPIPKGTEIHVSILNSNRNPELWGPDASMWKPERWLNPLPDTLVSARIPGVYSHLLTFIGGGRSCIGFKFSQLEMKVVLALLLENVEFSLSDKTIFWQMTGIVTPNTDTKSTTPTLPLVIRRKGI